MKSCEALTDDVLREYGDRKKSGRVSILVDTIKNEIYLVPRDVEHIDFMNSNFPDRNYEFFVPFHIDLRDGEVVSLISGETGLEYRLRVQHPPYAVEVARGLTFEFLRKGNKRLNLNK